MKEFILSDESKNNKGFRVLTAGINLKRFRQNPVMYFNHDRSMGVIGRWENIHITGGKLLATPVFDMKDPLGVKIAAKVEDGFIKAASIGIDEYKMESIEGENVIIYCSLYECSVCDIPCNENALALYMEDRVITDSQEIIKLSKTDKINRMDDLKPIIEALGLTENATVPDVVEAIRNLREATRLGNTLEEAVKMKYVSESEKDSLLALSYGNPDAFSAYLENRKKEVIQNRTLEGDQLIMKTIRSGKFNFSAKDFWLNAYIRDPEETKLALEALPPLISISSLIQKKENPGWTLSDYRKYAPQELKSNPGLYQTLLEEEKEQSKKQINNKKKWRR